MDTAEERACSGTVGRCLAQIPPGGNGAGPIFSLNCPAIRRPRAFPVAASRLLRTDLCCPALSLIMAIASAQFAGARAKQLADRDRPPQPRDGWLFQIRSHPAVSRGLEASRNAWRRTRPARRSFGRVFRRFRARSRPPLRPRAVQPLRKPARPYQGIASPFDPTQFRLPTLGLPPGLGTPEPTPEIKREYGQFVEREIAPENTIQVVVGRAKVIVLREKPRRIYIPDETVAGFQIVTDQQFAIVGKKIGRTVLNLWFPDPRNPNDPNRDRTLSYLVVVLPDPERAALDVLQERKRLEAQVKAYTQALKVLEREIKEAFPDSAVQLSLVGDQVVVRGESKDVVEAAQILRIVAEHTPTATRTKVTSRNVNVTFIPGLGDEQAAVNAIR